MFTSMKKLIISTIFIVLVVAAIVVFVPSWKIDKTIEETIEQLNTTYDDDFTITWSDLEKQPLASSFYATAKSTKSGIVYDVTIEDGVPKIDYEAVNELMAVNTAIEAELPAGYALTQIEGEGLYVRLLSPESFTEEELEMLAETIKEQQNVRHITLVHVQLEADSYETVTLHIDEFYQRDTVPQDAFENYDYTEQSLTR